MSGGQHAPLSGAEGRLPAGAPEGRLPARAPEGRLPAGAPEGGLRSWMRRLRSSTAELEAEELAEQSLRAGLRTICEAQPQHRVTLRGRVTSITLNPVGEHKWLEVEVTDGTGTVTVIWMGRRSITGVDPGRRLLVTGMLTRSGERKVIYNPAYELIAD